MCDDEMNAVLSSNPSPPGPTNSQTITPPLHFEYKMWVLCDCKLIHTV